VFPTLAGPRFVDWVDYADRNAAARPEEFAAEVLRRADGRTIWFVWSGNYKTLEGKCEAVLGLLAANRPQNAALVLADDEIYEFMGLNRFDP
jgi:ribosomal protein L2